MEKKNHKGDYVPNKLGLSSPLCKVCEEPYYLSKTDLILDGPIWLAELNNMDFVREMKEMMESEEFGLQLRTHKKIYGNLHAILEEK